MFRHHPRLSPRCLSASLLLLAICMAGSVATAWGQTAPCPVELHLDTVQALNGSQVTIPVIISTQVEIGGFDLLLCYDPIAVAPLSVSVGAAIQNWEYFTY